MVVRVTEVHETRITVTAATGINTQGVFQCARIQWWTLARDERYGRAEFMDVVSCLLVRSSNTGERNSPRNPSSHYRERRLLRELPVASCSDGSQSFPLLSLLPCIILLPLGACQRPPGKRDSICFAKIVIFDTGMKIRQLNLTTFRCVMVHDRRR